MFSLDYRILATWLISAGLVQSIQDSELFPYDEAAGSTPIPYLGNGMKIVFFKSPFKFLNQTHNSILISGNGIVSFQNATIDIPSGPSKARCQNGVSGHPRIMPFWSDSYQNPQAGSAHTYMETSRLELLKKAEDDVIAAFPVFRNQRLNLSWIFIVTWKNILPCCGGYSSLKNTYQLVLVKSQFNSFVLLYYPRVEWSGGGRWVAGFDFGDSRPPYLLPGSCTKDIKSIRTSTNLLESAQQGKWVFRVESNLIPPTTGKVLTECKPPNDLGNGQLHLTSLTIGSRLRATCDSGYILNSNLGREDIFTCANANGSAIRGDNVQWLNLQSNREIHELKCLRKQEDDHFIIKPSDIPIATTKGNNSGGGWGMVIFICCLLITFIIGAVIVAKCRCCRSLRMYFVNRFRPIPGSGSDTAILTNTSL